MISNKYNNFINIAINEAKKSQFHNKHGCVIISGGKIMGTGYNNLRNYSNDKLLQNCVCCHAEVAAIRNFLSNIKFKKKIKGTYGL